MSDSEEGYPIITVHRDILTCIYIKLKVGQVKKTKSIPVGKNLMVKLDQDENKKIIGIEILY